MRTKVKGTRRRIIGCLRKDYNADLREEEILRDLKEGKQGKAIPVTGHGGP
jgi:hypothetical protein